MKSLRRILFGASALLLSGTMAFSVALPVLRKQDDDVASADGSSVTGTVADVTSKVHSDLTQFLDTSVCEALPENVSADQRISVILSLDADTILDSYEENGEGTVADFAVSAEGKAITDSIERESNMLLRRLSNAGISYELGNRYDTLLGGFEVNILASAFDALCDAVDGKATVMVGEEYAECETEVVENDVKVYETGIFDSSDSQYDGKGTVIAVLDTGLDYTHSAFAVERFNNEPETDVITMEKLTGIVPKLTAAVTSPDLTAQSLYISRKVPYAYDYADKDDEVSPINSEHGTHVAGIMVGNDIEVNSNGIRGVAPNAQLAVMKVFSEKTSGAKTSWILAALEDCVTLGVDVINMSLGTAAGFSRETDDDQRTEIYDKIKEQGISLIAAASNDYNSTFGSEKNGNLPLTGNPDSATVGAPSTYDAALSVASISGVKTPYLLYHDNIIYFTESTNSAAKPKDFVSEILGEGTDSKEFEYVVIPGVGKASDYSFPEGYLNGKIALVKRGTTNFEEKANVARSMGAAGCIIYNNVSGDIAMNVGRLGNYPVCSISKDDGELLRAVEGGTGKITISRSQKAGPFMSDFSSWGPAPDLSIKPEITAHGGDIYSSVPGQRYDRLSGTSMASPNQAGFTALVRQYVKEHKDIFGVSTSKEITEAVNQLMMSTTDIAHNTNGLPFSVRKQGSGLANLTKATSSPAYLQTFDRHNPNEIMDKAKIELGDDPDRNGIYTLKFNIKNISDGPVAYHVGAIVMTEGVSETNTYKGDKTVTQKGYMLDPDVRVESAEGGSLDGSKVTVAAKTTATVTVTITLSGKDREYLDTSFKNGMYVEGFVTLDGADGTAVNLNAPYLAFYGDWGAAPLFDLDYFDTYKDELNDTMETLDKVLPDAYATRPLGGLYDDYIVYLGAYPFLQDPNSVNKVAADRDRIALSNQVGSETEGQGGVNSIYAFYLGLLRNAKKLVMTVTDTVTGEEIYRYEEENVRKSYNYGGSIGPTVMRVDFNTVDCQLKNNTKYQVAVKGYIDYDDGTVANDVFEFPFYTDFTAPIVTDVEYTYEYDKENKKNRLFANVSIFDNHYVQALATGYIANSPAGSGAPYTLYSFERYLTPVSGVRNSTNIVQIELTDYLETIKNESYNGRSFMIQAIDCAENTAIYELPIPDDIACIEFKEETIEISPNQVYTLSPTVAPVQSEAWMESIVYTSSDENIARVVNGKLIGISSGEATITAKSTKNEEVTDTVQVKVLAPGDEGYNGHYANLTIEPNSFRLTGYLVNRVYYAASSDERDLGVEEPGYSVKFSTLNPSLKMFPSESITLEYDFTAYLDKDNYRVTFSSNRPNIVSVDDKGQITALNQDEKGNPLDEERSATITATLCMKDAEGNFKSIGYSRTVNITVKVPYITNGPYLMSYKGLGGKVTIPDDYGFTTIQDFAFSNYKFVPKDLAAGDVIDDEDPYGSKQWYIGDNTITEVIIPEGVESIGLYAFAGLTALKSITLPSTLTKIQTGAFLGCTALTEVKFSGANNLQFINESAFENCDKLINFNFDSLISIGNNAFKKSGLFNVHLTKKTQSIGAEAFADCDKLSHVTIEASKIKIGAGAFRGCSQLKDMGLNTSVLPAEVFKDCTSLESLTIGPDVEVIGQEVFRGTKISNLNVDEGNTHFEKKTSNGTGTNGVQYLVEKANPKVLVLVAPTATTFIATDIEEIATGALSSAKGLTSVTLSNVKKVGDYAFAGCTLLRTITLGSSLESVGKYAFYQTKISTQPTLAEGVTIGEYAFFETGITSVEVPKGAEVGAGAYEGNTSLKNVEVKEEVNLGEKAFFGNYNLETVTIGNDVTIGTNAFGAVRYSDVKQGLVSASSGALAYDPYLSAMKSLTIGSNAIIGDYAFAGAGSVKISTAGNSPSNGELKKVCLGDGATIGNYAFYACHQLTDIDLSKAKSIGNFAFSGVLEVFTLFRSGGQVWAELVGYVPFAPAFTSVTLSALSAETPAEDSAETPTETPANLIGAGAFSMNTALTTVTLPEGTTDIAPYTFMGCTALATVNNLSGVKTVGAAAFADSALTEVTLAEGATVDAEAFAGCESLATIDLKNVVSIGASAFTDTAITEADLTSAQSVGDYAFVGSNLESVTLGDQLSALGENPFAGCEIPAFSKDGKTTFDIGTQVKVIDGVLYDSCPNGLVLVCYPLGKTADKTSSDKTPSFKVQDGTVRIGAMAFLNADIFSVELARQVQAIGDRAFYGCENLSVVIFTSISAPLLEETYLEEYETETDEIGAPLYLVDAVGYYMASLNGGGEKSYGQKIVDFRMWMADPTSVLYGANFVARIGDEEGRATLAQHPLIMVRPINGTGYDNFIYRQYFKTTVEGPTAITDATAQVIALIDALPDSVSLNDKASIEAIRALYNALTVEQQACVTNLQKLVEAERTIEYLEQQQQPSDDPTDVGPSQEEKGGCGSYIGAGAAVAVALLLAVCALGLCKKEGKRENSVRAGKK